MVYTASRAELIGRLGQAPTVRTAQNGQTVVSFSVATEHTGKDGHRVTDWHAVVCFGTQADFAARYLTRGRLVYVAGRLVYRTYEGADGQPRHVAEIIAQEVGALDRPPAPAPGEGETDADQ